MKGQKAFNKVIDKYGHYVLVVQTDEENPIRCSCYNEETMSASRSCNKCYGQGYLVTIKPYLCWTTITSIPETLARATKYNETSSINNISRIFYFKTEAQIKSGNIVINCEFDYNMKPILSEFSAYEVTTVDLIRENQGKASFIRAFSSVNAINVGVILSNAINTSEGVVYLGSIRR